MEYRIVYNPRCFYWTVLDKRGAEVAWGITKEAAEAALKRLLTDDSGSDS